MRCKGVKSDYQYSVTYYGEAKLKKGMSEGKMHTEIEVFMWRANNK